MRKTIKKIKIKYKNLGFILVIISLSLALSACKLYQQSGNQTDATGETVTNEEVAVEGAATVTYSDSGFEPKTVTVKSGEAITWINNSSGTVQVGSANHPTHTVNQEITGSQFVLSLAPGESKTVAVTKTGSWGYHDHLKPSITGTVVVE